MTKQSHDVFPYWKYTCLWTTLFICGCVTVDSSAKLDESVRLTEARTGYEPEWHVPWDGDSPLWDGRSALELDTAVVLSLRNNRTLRGQLEMIGQANADLVQAGLLQNPTLNFMIMFPEGGGRSMLRSGGFPMQALSDLWLIPARKDAAGLELQKAILNVAQSAIDLAAEAKKKYARIQYFQRAVELIQANMRIVEQSTKIIQTQQSAGKAGQVDVNLSRIRQQRLQSELIQHQSEMAMAKRELLTLMGFAQANADWKVDPLDELKQEVDPAHDENELLALALEQRIDLLAAHWGVQAAQARINLMKRSVLDHVAIGFTFERGPAPRSSDVRVPGKVGNILANNALRSAAGMPLMSVPEIMPFSAQPNVIDFMSGPMLDMEIPIFDQNQAQIAKAIHEYNQNVAEFEALQQSVVENVRRTSVQQQQDYEQVELYRQSILPEVESNLKLARQSYTAGQVDLTVYLLVQEDLIKTRLEALTFTRDYLLSRAELERAVGGSMILKQIENIPPTESAPAQSDLETEVNHD
ncbi:MAG: hypothetical protein HJJLKODD_00704 [Phycisphaerae bacterium]|nr:hypothetical protein [Phycisphaerae bacterium]